MNGLVINTLASIPTIFRQCYVSESTKNPIRNGSWSSTSTSSAAIHQSPTRDTPICTDWLARRSSYGLTRMFGYACCMPTVSIEIRTIQIGLTLRCPSFFLIRRCPREVQNDPPPRSLERTGIFACGFH